MDCCFQLYAFVANRFLFVVYVAIVVVVAIVWEFLFGVEVGLNDVHLRARGEGVPLAVGKESSLPEAASFVSKACW